MNKKDSSQEHGSLSDVLAEDNAIDRIALGEHYEDADQLLALLACARAEVDKDIPAPPVMADLLGQDFYTEEFHTQEFQAQSAESDAPVPLTSRRSGVFRRSASTAIAAGGASISAMLTAGGVAAALAVGGLGYVAYTKSQVEETQAPTESMEPSTATNGATDTTASETGGVEESKKPAESDSATPTAESLAKETTGPTAVVKPSETPASTEETKPSETEETDSPSESATESAAETTPENTEFTPTTTVYSGDPSETATAAPAPTTDTTEEWTVTTRPVAVEETVERQEMPVEPQEVPVERQDEIRVEELPGGFPAEVLPVPIMAIEAQPAPTTEVMGSNGF